MKTERHCIIKDYPDYVLYESGKVVSYKRYKNGKELKHSIAKNGYKIVNLYNQDGYKSKDIHRLIAVHFIENPDNLPVVDHWNRDKLDNRIKNLRWVTYSENVSNRDIYGETPYKGVHFHKKRKTYQATGYINGKNKYLGTFTTAEEASEAYQNFIKTLKN